MPEKENRREATLRSLEALSIAIAVRSMPKVLQPLLDTSLSIQQLKTLSLIVTTERGATGSNLAASFGVTMASMSNLLDRLVARGLVVRSVDSEDSRVRRVHPTELGRAIVAEIMAARPELGLDVLSGLSEGELEALELGMRAVSRELRSLAEMSPTTVYSRVEKPSAPSLS
jgi:DNA-binding MarR family transcriptional regulator